MRSRFSRLGALAALGFCLVGGSAQAGGPAASKPTVQFKSSAFNVNESVGLAVLTVTRSSKGTSDVDLALSGGNATRGNACTTGVDYVAPASQTLHFVNATAVNVSVQICDDTLYEGTGESFNGVLSSPTGGTALGSVKTTKVAVKDNDPAPSLSVTNITGAVTEGSPITFRITPSAASGVPFSVNYTTSDNTAVQPSDYTTAAGSAAWAPGDSTSRDIVVTTHDDGVYGLGESFNFDISSPGNASLGTSHATGTLTEASSAPTISVSVVSASPTVACVCVGTPEGSDITFRVTPSAASEATMSVHYATADDSAVQPSDYDSASDDLTWLAGDSAAKDVTVTTHDDNAYGLGESFDFTISSPSHASLGTSSATGVLTETSAPPVFTAISSEEGNEGSTLTFTVTETGASEATSSVDYSTGSPGTATAGTDYTAVSTTTLNFGAFVGPTQTQTLDVFTLDNSSPCDGSLTFSVNLANPVNATGTPTGTGTIDEVDFGDC